MSLVPLSASVAERRAACCFSSTIRRYSAALQFPAVIIHQRRNSVSHDATVNSAIMDGNVSAFTSRVFFAMLSSLRLPISQQENTQHVQQVRR
jgi:hypothetical protein